MNPDPPASNGNGRHHDHRHPSPQCLELFARLSEYLDRELDADDCRRIEHHLADCRPCRNCMQALQRTVELCKSMGQEKVPADVSRRLRELVRQLR